jgi:hypothetical protein
LLAILFCEGHAQLNRRQTYRHTGIALQEHKQRLIVLHGGMILKTKRGEVMYLPQNPMMKIH